MEGWRQPRPNILSCMDNAFWAQVWPFYCNELRMALRERNTVINSLLIPVFLYPVLFWLVISIFSYIQGSTAGKLSRVQVSGLPAAHAGFKAQLGREKGIRLVDGDVWEARRAVRRGTLDLLVEFLPPEAAGLPGDYQVRLVYDAVKDRSVAAKKRLQGLLDDYRDTWLHGTAVQHGLTEAQWQVFAVSMHNVSSDTAVGGSILSIVLPLIFVMMVAVGCFYPAIDTIAGERERQTWEALMTTSASRAGILTAKYLAVTTFGWLAGILNITTMVLTLKPLLGQLLAEHKDSIAFTLPWSGVPVIFLGALLLAAFLAAGMMCFAAFARTFKDGQAMVMPFYFCAILPVLLVQGDDLQFTPLLACLPVANVAMVIREAITGVYHWPLIGLTAAVSLALITGCLALATRVLRTEDILLGSYDGNLWHFLRTRTFTQR